MRGAMVEGKGCEAVQTEGMVRWLRVTTAKGKPGERGCRGQREADRMAKSRERVCQERGECVCGKR